MTADDVIKALDLKPHPVEGGFFRGRAAILSMAERSRCLAPPCHRDLTMRTMFRETATNCPSAGRTGVNSLND